MGRQAGDGQTGRLGRVLGLAHALEALGLQAGDVISGDSWRKLELLSLGVMDAPSLTSYRNAVTILGVAEPIKGHSKGSAYAWIFRGVPDYLEAATVQHA